MTTRLSSAAVIPLRTLDPRAPLDDLDWLGEAIGDARVVAIAESAHYNREFLELRHRVLRYLIERRGFSAYAMESGFVEGWRVDEWVRGGEGDLGDVLATGLTSLMGLWTPVREQLTWLREHNRTAERPVGFYGIDLPGSMVSMLPGLDATLAYLASADPAHKTSLRETAALFAAPSAFSAAVTMSAYAGADQPTRDALTAGLAELVARMTGRRLDYVAATGVDAYERALRSLLVTVALDGVARDMARGDRESMMFGRDRAIADTVEWILGREDRVVLAAHNGHVQRWRGTIPGVGPMTPMGMHLADRLGEDYVVIGTTSGTGETLNTDADFYTGRLFAPMEAPEPGTVDALMHASHDGPFAVDLRRLSAADADAVRAHDKQRAGIGAYTAEQHALDAFDAIVHLPHVTGAAPDRDAVAHSPEDVQRVFANWPGEA